MAPKIQHKRSAVKDKQPLPADLEYGELAVNYEATDPALYIKDSADAVRKIGNQPAATEAVSGIVELATAAETTTGTDSTRAVHPAGLKVELDKKAPLANPALTGVPTAPTAAAGTNTTQLATTAFVTDAVAKENTWDRAGTVVSPATAGDQVHTATGKLTVGGTAAAPSIEIKADGGIVANTDGLVYDAATKQLGIGATSPSSALEINAGVGKSPFIAKINNAEKVRIDPDGRFLAGMSSAPTAGNSQYAKIAMQGNTGSATGGSVISLQRGASATSIAGDLSLGEIEFADNAGNPFARIIGISDAAAGAGDYPGRIVLATTADGASSPMERVRVDSKGNILIGTTNITPANSNVVGTCINPAVTEISRSAGVSLYLNRDTNDGNVAVFNRSGKPVGGISVTGAATAYNTSSDYRLKENVTAVTDGITRLQQLKPSRFNFKVDPSHTVDGFIAHEAQAVVPECVTGTKDEVDADGNPVYQGIDQSKIVPLLTAALQEAIAKIESLEARLTAAGI